MSNNAGNYKTLVTVILSHEWSIRITQLVLFHVYLFGHIGSKICWTRPRHLKCQLRNFMHLNKYRFASSASALFQCSLAKGTREGLCVLVDPSSTWNITVQRSVETVSKSSNIMPQCDTSNANTELHATWYTNTWTSRGYKASIFERQRSLHCRRRSGSSNPGATARRISCAFIEASVELFD